jgi:hypothetical protein
LERITGIPGDHQHHSNRGLPQRAQILSPSKSHSAEAMLQPDSAVQGFCVLDMRRLWKSSVHSALIKAMLVIKLSTTYMYVAPSL